MYNQLKTVYNIGIKEILFTDNKIVKQTLNLENLVIVITVRN